MAATDPIPETEEAADRLDRAWDDLVAPDLGADRPSPDGHPGGPAAGLVAAARRFHARDDAPAPDPAFAARLRRELLGAADVSAPGSGARIGLVPFAGRPSVVELVAAAAVVLLLLGGQLTGPGLVPSVSASPTVAAEEAPLPTVAGVPCPPHRAAVSPTATPRAARGSPPQTTCDPTAE